jgi:CRISPR-associated protein Cmr3
MQLFIEPVDVWLFRDGRSFNASEDHWAKSLFPPFPGVMQGIIRSHQLVVKQVDLAKPKDIEKEIGTNINYNGLTLRGPLLMKKERDAERYHRYYPAPGDALTTDTSNKCLIKCLTPAEKLPDGVKTSIPTPRLLLLPNEIDPVKGESNLWLSEDVLTKYLKGDIVASVPGRDLFQIERRFGIGRDDTTRTTRQVNGAGLLYEAEFIRPYPGVGLWVEVEGYDWPDNGLLRMGGEGRGGYFTQLDGAKPPLAQAGQKLPAQFKLYFATPTYFAGGWQPETGNWNQYFTGPVTLQAAAIGRYQSIGGYDWARHAHKPAHRYVPAGSVYYFSAESQPVSLKQDWVCDPTPDGAVIGQIGFGQVIAVSWE